MYAVLSTGSIGQVFGGYDGDGGYVDDTGAPTTSVPLAVNLVFHPHWWVFALIVLVALAGIRVGRLRSERGTNPLGRTAPFAIAIVALTVLAIVVTGPVFFLGTDSTELASIHLPWWVGADVTISRQP
ncbi:hypothetical protein GCM10009617_09100 [Leifsonia poae]|uniref:Uncharacterized protein n=2 Tax=Leifsonia poae TaxID=110933 RepID=A0A9W6LZ11_9MICO|nr:hypothetical protein GCM10017584_10090 [Leifsonia poae]